MQDTYMTQTPTATFFLTDAAPTFTVITVEWSLCTELTGNCDGFLETDLDMSRASTGWTQYMMLPGNGPASFARENGMRNMDYISLTVRAVDDAGDDYKTTDATKAKWLTTEELPAPVDMEDDLLDWYVADLLSDIEELEEQLADSSDASLDARLMELEAKLDIACEDARTNCPTEELQSNAVGDEESLNTTVIFIILGVLIVAALLGLMFMRGGRGDVEEAKWNEATLPVHDAVANSMYGGAQEIFQQPVAQAPVAHAPVVHAPVAPVPVAPVGAPPLPPGGLPAGWTMEQWTYYGQQYLDQLNQQ
jgi:hypothetical protein